MLRLDTRRDGWLLVETGRLSGPRAGSGHHLLLQRSETGWVVAVDGPWRACEAWMDGVIGYLNTDLDLTSADDLAALAAAFEAGGVPPLHATRGEAGLWYACFETAEQYAEPEPTIAAMLAVVESLPPPLRAAWAGCSRREVNVGYDCGLEPWAFNQGLSAECSGGWSLPPPPCGSPSTPTADPAR